MEIRKSGSRLSIGSRAAYYCGYWSATVAGLGFVLLFCLLLLGGCTSAAGTRRSYNPLDWIFGRRAAAAATTEAKQAATGEAMVHAAQLEVAKTGAALAAARTEHPESRPVEVAERTNANAAALLNQRSPLSLAEMQQALDTARGLLSAEASARESAERAQAAAETSAAKLSTELGELRARLQAMKADLAAEAETNLRLANRLRAATLWKWASTAGAVLLGALALAYRYNLGNLQVGVGQALGAFQKKYGTSDEDLTAMQHSIDALVSQAQQRAISAVATAALKS